MRRSSRSGSPPMPMLPSMSSTVGQRPSPGRSRTRCAAGPAAPGRGSARRRSRRCRRPSAATPRSVSADTNRPGPQPTSSTGPMQRSSTVSSHGVGRRRASGRRRARRCVPSVGAQAERAGRRAAPARTARAHRSPSAPPVGTRRRRRGGERAVRRERATSRAASKVSTSVSSSSSCTRRPSALQAGQLVGAGVRRSTSARRRWPPRRGAGRRSRWPSSRRRWPGPRQAS